MKLLIFINNVHSGCELINNNLYEKRQNKKETDVGLSFTPYNGHYSKFLFTFQMRILLLAYELRGLIYNLTFRTGKSQPHIR
jgi:hypothetical protein